MKRLLCIILSISYIFLCSCTDENDLFEEPAADRLTATLAEYKSILTGAKNGWIMEYYAGEEPSKNGGYTYLCLFGSDGKVTAASELDIGIHAAGDKVTSLYKLIANQGIVLTFDTYNDLLHYFSTPSKENPNGMKGDYEFIIKEVSPQKVVMQGKKWKNIITMTPMPEDITWEDYLDGIIKMVESGFYPMYKLLINGKEADVEIKMSFETRLFTFTGASSTLTQNILYTPAGFKFYLPITIDGVLMQNFAWDQIHNIYRCTDKGVDAVLSGSYPVDYLFYSEILGIYLFQYKDRNSTEIMKTGVISESVNNESYRVSGLGDFDFVFDYDRSIGGLTMKSQPLHSAYYMCMWIGDLDVDIGTKVYYRGFPVRDVNDIKIKFEGQESPTPIGFIVVEKNDNDYHLYDDGHCFSNLVMTKQ